MAVPVVSYDTQPGDVMFFHPRLLQAGIGSARNYPRRTFSIRFLGDDIRWRTKKSVPFDWAAKIPLADCDRIAGDRFPVQL
jgi:hypothetical protein